MTAFSLNHGIHLQWKTALENAAYTALSAILIGQIFFVQGMVNLENALLVLLGVMFGILAIYGLTPLSNLASGKDVRIPAEVLYFSITQDDAKHSTQMSDRHDKRAA